MQSDANQLQWRHEKANPNIVSPGAGHLRVVHAERIESLGFSTLGLYQRRPFGYGAVLGRLDQRPVALGVLFRRGLDHWIGLLVVVLPGFFDMDSIGSLTGLRVVFHGVFSRFCEPSGPL